MPLSLIHHVEGSGNEELIRNLDTAHTARLDEDFFRACIRRDDPQRYFCFFIDTNREPVRVVRDPSALPNRADP